MNNKCIINTRLVKVTTQNLINIDITVTEQQRMHCEHKDCTN